MMWLRSLISRDQFPQRPADAPLGPYGEALAAAYLRRKGYKIILQNFRCATGEIDLIARDGKILVFVEVKTRESDYVAPEAQVDAAKERKVINTARVYLSKYGASVPDYRFDIVAILCPPNVPPQILHDQGAFA